jgi:uncharacterized protein with HEPN domain
MRDERAYLADMIFSARRIQKIVAGKSLEAVTNDENLQDALLRRLGIIGEAANRISQATRDQLPTVPWRDIMKMRNVLIHVYFSVDLKIALDTATNDMEPRIAAIDAHLKLLDAEAGNP